MSIHSTIKSIGQILHLDGSSFDHAVDAASRRVYKGSESWRANYRLLGVKDALPSPNDEPTKTEDLFPSLGLGVRMDHEGKEVSEHEHIELHQALISDRSWYWASYKKRNGKMGTRKRDLRTNKKIGEGKNKKTVILPGSPLKNLAITFRPDHSLALSLLDQSGVTTREFVKHCACDAAERFEDLTPYEVVSMNVHSGDGNLHFHLAYSVVDEKNNLLHKSRNRGRKGIRTLGAYDTGVSRIASAHLPFDDEIIERAENHRLAKTADGGEVIDWAICKALDDAVDGVASSVACDEEIKSTFIRAADAWRRHITAKFEASPKQLQRKLQENEEKADVLAAEAAEAKRVAQELKKALEAARAELAATEAKLQQERQRASAPSAAQVAASARKTTEKNGDWGKASAQSTISTQNYKDTLPMRADAEKRFKERQEKGARPRQPKPEEPLR